MIVPDGAPPLAVYCAPYGGLGLKTKSYAAALARIEGLLASSVDVVHQTAELSVCEPCSQAMAESVLGPMDKHTAGMSGGGRAIGDAAAMVATHGHTLDALAAEAWKLFGPPTNKGARMKRGGPHHVEWRWLIEDPVKAPLLMPTWTPFVSANDQLMYDDYSTMVQVRTIWEMRLRVSKNRVVAAPYPPSRVHAHLRGKHASAFLDLVLPHESATDLFLADYQAINRALGITIPMKGYKLCAPKKKGGGRTYKKLPGL